MKARLIAYYLPQFHPIPENDAVWGPGFTEWTNVAKARPLFRGHYQPKIPADLGFYDLRLPETRMAQAQLAREAGIEGFCYWHYWMGGGRQLLQRPFQEVVASGQPDFPFCLAWANHDWTTKTWQNNGSTQMIAKQEYPGEQDYRAHFDSLLTAFRDKRYITIDGRLVFLIYDPYHFTDVARFMQCWRQWAIESGLPGFSFLAMCNATTTILRQPDGTLERCQPDLVSSANVYRQFLQLGFDGVVPWGKARGEMLAYGKYRRLFSSLLHERLPNLLPAQRYDYPRVMRNVFAPEDAWDNVYPTVTSNWDRSPRVGRADGIYVNSTPANFQHHLEQAVQLVQPKSADHRVLFLRSWNEWGEGNYVEPCTKYGHGYLDAISNAIR